MPYVIVYLVTAYFLGWWPFANTEKAILESQYNVYFYYPETGRELYIGEAEGLSQCKVMANSQAHALDMQYEDWDYICCRITSSSDCESKHR